MGVYCDAKLGSSYTSVTGTPDGTVPNILQTQHTAHNGLSNAEQAILICSISLAVPIIVIITIIIRRWKKFKGINKSNFGM